jgi:hypothetical protein
VIVARPATDANVASPPESARTWGPALAPTHTPETNPNNARSVGGTEMSIEQESTRQESAPVESPAEDAPSPARRIFRIVDGGQSTDLEDPLPGASDERVIGVLKTQITRLTGATQESRVEGNTRVVILTVRTGTKG